MSWVKKWQGKRVRINVSDPVAIAQCDYTDFSFNHGDLVKQMEWRGDRLQWTGYMVARPYLDVPNEQLRPPPVKADPYPIKDPRLPQPYGANLSQGPELSTQQIIKELNTSYWGPFEGNAVIPNPQPVSPQVAQSIPDGYPVPSTQQVVDRLNKYHWGAD
jgi:hypothetical protein